LLPYDPLFRNPHLITIASNFWKRPLDTERFPVEAIRLRTDPQTEILVHAQHPPGEPKASLILVHGLEGSSEGGYMRSLAQAALHAGYAVYRTNIRGCGGTVDWCQTLYHAGMTKDLHSLLRHVAGPKFLVGFSLGGNQVLKLAAELGQGNDAQLLGVCSVSAPLDLAACSKKLEAPSNFIYERRFVRSMKEKMRERQRLMPDVFQFNGVLDGIRTVWDLDDRITAKFFAFGSAENYYRTQSAIGCLSKIAVPALLIAAKDDPLVPFDIYRHASIAANPHIRLIATEHGGHVSFLARRRPRFWLDGTIIDWMESVRS
jgi:predicted alpha/beta-fold hydrolase